MPANIYPKKLTRLPRHAKAFGKPIRLNHAGRRQVRATFYIRRYADSFKHRGLAGLDLAKAIVEDISKFEQVEVSHERAQALWARRSADNIIRTKKVIVVKYTKADLGKHANVIQGCTDMTQAAVAGLRAAGFRVLIAREMLHTQAKMLYKEGNRWKVFIIDPESTGKMFREMNAGDKRREEGCKRHGMYNEGASLAEIGITSYENFFKYAPKPIRSG